jgi:hypothetical protein
MHARTRKARYPLSSARWREDNPNNPKTNKGTEGVVVGRYMRRDLVMRRALPSLAALFSEVREVGRQNGSVGI